MSLDSKIIEEIAAELSVDPAFVEKDWYSVQVLAAISNLQSDSVTTIFSGGTSLSKGYGLIQRFSEELDFRCQYNSENSGNKNKNIRRQHSANILNSIENISSIGLDLNTVKKASNYIKFPLVYPQFYTAHSALRPNLEVEFSFTQPRLKCERRKIQSLVSKFTDTIPQKQLYCVYLQ